MFAHLLEEDELKNVKGIVRKILINLEASVAGPRKKTAKSDPTQLIGKNAGAKKENMTSKVMD